MHATSIIEKFEYQPVTIRRGGTVTWINLDAVPHDIEEVGRAFKTPVADPRGGAITLTFNTPGTFGFVCTLHPIMYGEVVVR